MKLIYFAPVPFDSYWQRPHYMMRYLLENGFDQVTWVNPYPTRLPVLSDLKRRGGKPAPANALPGLKVVRPRAMPIEPLPVLNHANRLLWRGHLRSLQVDHSTVIGVGRPSRMALSLLRRSPQVVSSFVDVMDDFSAFYRGLSRRSMRHIEQATIREARHVICSAPTLADKYASLVRPRQIELIPNGYDMARLPAARDAAPQGQPVIGFVGSIASWFDWELVIEMANALPGCCVRLVGPVFGDLPRQLPANIEMLGECRVDQAVAHIRNFTVGIIPFRHNELTRSVDPIKFYEMRALGVPVWSTEFGTMTQRVAQGEAALMVRGAKWADLLDDACSHLIDATEIARFRREYDWNCRFSGLVARLRGGV